MTNLRQSIIKAVQTGLEAGYYEDLDLTIQHYNAEASELWDLFQDGPMSKSQLRKLRQYIIIITTDWIGYQLDGADVKASSATISKALHEAGLYEALSQDLLDHIPANIPENIEGLKRIML